jgi:translation initiation factor 2 beta subunit (eIF-2beta)/eIF-5
MDNKISTHTKEELVQVLVAQYQKSSKKDKTQILDQFIAVSGYHRKHTIRFLSGKTGSNGNQSNSCKISRSRRIYDEEVKEALIISWEAADRICSKW